MTKLNWSLIIAISVMMALIAFLYSVRFSVARDLGQWDTTSQQQRQWYQGLMQPDNPSVSCCGESDAYWADEVHYRDGKTYAVITDDRDDAPRMRPHIDIGTEFEVPNFKLKYDQGNPTGHGVIFLSRGGWVYCYVLPGGV